MKKRDSKSAIIIIDSINIIDGSKKDEEFYGAQN
ncbi:hypothetical protein DFR58_10376 [Anaerobacterium chartisolvens]|uniref:Uncharacterized protein n=1 Tax=Anaerobacterium chartisolvens TaxID=1297424 RepID=A0A369BD55_9FIRM|nr:hypothetical protein DFR58_10376 [Anaerobacterium chartisolvens]